MNAKTKTKTKRTLRLLAVLLWFPFCAQAQEAPELLPTHFTRSGSTYGFGIITSCFDSYLSPNNYMGLELNLMNERWRRFSEKYDNLFQQSISETSVGITEAGSTSSMMVTNETLTDAIVWRLARLGVVDVYAGPEMQFRFGADYNTRNSNNPVNVQLGLHLAGTAMAEVRYRIGRLPARSSYQIDMPVVGAVFAPQYTQSYYEIFSLKHYGGIVHFASPFNAFSMRRILTTELTHRDTIFRLVFENDAYQWRTSTNSYAFRTFRIGFGYVFNSYSILPREKAYRHIPY